MDFWISFVLDCVFGFVLFILDSGGIYTVCLDFLWIWDLELGGGFQTFVCFFGFVLLRLESLGPKGEC